MVPVADLTDYRSGEGMRRPRVPTRFRHRLSGRTRLPESVPSPFHAQLWRRYLYRPGLRPAAGVAGDECPGRLCVLHDPGPEHAAVPRPAGGGPAASHRADGPALPVRGDPDRGWG